MSGPSVGSSTHGSGLEGEEATVIIERGNWYNRDNSIKDKREEMCTVSGMKWVGLKRSQI
jgi:hypothetical protein